MKKPVLSLIPLIGLLGPAHAQLSPIVYVTQVPPAGVIETITSIGNNHLPGVSAAPRGGDLMIRYGSGAIRNLTREAGFGSLIADQGIGSIAVRDPHIHWSGQRILFSMVVTSANPSDDRWQMYEATGFEQGSTVQITKVASQPAQFNNVQACYAPDDCIIFVSDRTLDGTLATYPAIDEKGQGRINTGLWSLNTDNADLIHLDHSPSGSFDPFVDRYGRVVFTRWDHLQRDESATAAPLTAFDYSSESAVATFHPGTFSDTFPEAVSAAGTENGHQFDLFMPWTVNPDGTDLLTLNHVGRHEISPSAMKSRNDSNLMDMTVSSPNVNMVTPVRAASLMHLAEVPTYSFGLLGTDALFTGLSAGRLVTMTGTQPSGNPSNMQVMLTSGSNILRDPTTVSSGTSQFVVASTADLPAGTANISSSTYGGVNTAVATPPPNPNLQLGPANPFTIRISTQPFGSTAPLTFTTPLVQGTAPVTVVNYDNGQARAFTGRLWELQPVEVRATPRPQSAVTKLEAPEQEIFISTGVSPLALKSWLRSRDLAVMSVRNVTQRDAADRQQPINLSVEGGKSSTGAFGGPTYKVKSLQLMQGEYLRGYAENGTMAKPGRRIKAKPASVSGVVSAPAGLPEGSTPVSLDGSAAVLVPAGRATSWQLLDHGNSPVVRERYWLSFQAGEIRTCTSCHGVNNRDQAGQSVASNPPDALRALLQSVKETSPELAAGSVFQVWSEGTYGMTLRPGEDDDADGTSNMMEWGMGSNPVSASDKPAKPLTVTLLNALDDKYARVSFSRSLTQPRAVTVLEASTDMITWRAVTSLSSVVTTVNPAYSIRRTTAGSGKIEEVELTSGFPIRQTADRYYRLRVTAN